MTNLGDWFRMAVVWVALVGVACGSGGATPSGGPKATLTKIEVTPTGPRVPSGTTQQLTATGVFSDSTTQDLTSRVIWASDAAAHATVSSTGSVAGVAPGTATITATMGSISGATTVTVTDAVLVSIGVTPIAPSLPVGEMQQFTATGTFSDRTTRDLTNQVTWASETGASATVSNMDGSRGLATTQAVGTTRITATLGAVTGATTLTVTAAVLDSIALTPVAPSVPLGRTQQFTVTGTFSDATTLDLTNQATWGSDDPVVATISNADGSRGLVTALEEGLSVVGLENSVDPFRFDTARWQPTGFTFSSPVFLDGTFDLGCISPFNITMGQQMPLVLSRFGSSDDVTITFVAQWRAPESLFSIDQLGAQIQP